MTFGQIFIISNPIYSHYGSNVYMIGCSSNPHQTIDILSTAFTQPFETHYLSSIYDREHLLSDIYDKLKYNRISPNKQLFMLPNLQMVQQMINDSLTKVLLTGQKAINTKVISPFDHGNENEDIFIDDELICEKMAIVKTTVKNGQSVSKTKLDDDISVSEDDSDDEDINTFRNLLASTECVIKTKTPKGNSVKTTKKAITKKTPK